MQLTNFTLPEWVFLDANCHTGNELENRTVIQHVRSYTIIEIVAMDEFTEIAIKNDVISRDMTYINEFGVAEYHKLLVHFSLASEDFEIKQVLDEAAKWYYDYLTWEDNNIKFFGDDTNGN